MRTAIVLTDSSAFSLRADAQERERRAFATERVCDLVAMGLIEGAEYATRSLLEPKLGYDTALAARERMFPGYCFIRNFLIGELDADPVIAARVAAKHTALHNRLLGYLRERRGPFHDGREVGWQ